MGCVSSKVDNEEIVSRCKERRRLMKQAVCYRHKFAAAHSAYIMALKNTGIALRDFADGEHMVINSNNNNNNNSNISVSGETATPTMASSRSQSQRRHMKFHPPPPPPMETSPSASPSIASSRVSSRRIPNTISSSDYGSPLPPPPPPPPPPPIRPLDRNSDDFWASSLHYFDNNPSHQGSEWNNNAWEPFYTSSSPQIHGHEYKKSKHETDRMSEGGATECIDDSNSSTDFDEEEEEVASHSNARAPTPGKFYGPDYGDDARAPTPSKFYGPDYGDDVSSVTASWYTKEDTEMQMVVARNKHRDFKEIALDLNKCFARAADAGKEVSKLLETRRAQNEFETKKSLYHSSNVFDSLPWTWSSKPPLTVRYTLEPSIFDTSGTHGSHCSTLERIHAWERKLYQEVRNGEARKIEQEKKLALLQSQEVRGENVLKVDKTNASIKRLQSLIIVANQAINTTSTAILKLRESELYPQLAELAEGLMLMWRSMNECHRDQNLIVQQVKNLETTASREATSDTHRQVTLQLEAEVNKWYSSFCSLMKSQKEYIRALHGWVRLSLLQLGVEVNSEQGNRPPIYTICDEWQHALEKLPDKVASEAIKSFISVVHTIVGQQDEEQKHKKKTENLSKELQKKMIALRNIEHKYYSSYSIPSNKGLTSESGYELEAIDPLGEKRAEIDLYRRRVEEEKTNYSKTIQVTREMTLNSIQTGLPGVFQAMTGFSSVCTQTFETVCNQTKSLNYHSSRR